MHSDATATLLAPGMPIRGGYTAAMKRRRRGQLDDEPGHKQDVHAGWSFRWSFPHARFRETEPHHWLLRVEPPRWCRVQKRLRVQSPSGEWSGRAVGPAAYHSPGTRRRVAF